MSRSSLVALTLSSLLCSSCATKHLVAYPSNVWPALNISSTCAATSGKYEGMTDDVWPNAVMLGTTAKLRRSLASILAEVSPVSRPENLSTVRRVDIDLPSRQAKLFGAWEDVVDMSDWQCSDDGALEVSITRDADGEHSFDASVEIRFELRLAADHSLIVHQYQQFYNASIKSSLRESWYRFLPALSP
jgi:hypothetical protein